MIGSFESLLRRGRRWFSRNEWVLRLLRLPKTPESGDNPGLVLIQIDGLSRTQLDRALAEGRMPFLQRLIRREGYLLNTLYSGLPSNTPGFQGAFFYGVPGLVPAFSFKHKPTQKIIRMYEPESVALIQGLAEKETPGLLKAGSAYLDVLSGGATESHFCPATIGWESLRNVRAVPLILIFLGYSWSFVRVAGLLVLELLLAVIDCVKGLIAGLDLWKELKFVPTRVAICILLREIVTVGAALDTARGLPIIHLNYVGYDEQAHRRGPYSAFAHWTLKGIDDAVRRVWKTAQRSSMRDYDVWIYSDHGQEWTIPYSRENGRTLQQAVRKVFDEVMGSSPQTAQKEEGIQLRRAQWFGGAFGRWLIRKLEKRKDEEGRLLVTAMGPLGHIYPGKPFDSRERHRMAQRLAEEANIPLVLVAGLPGSAHAWTKNGTFVLPRDAKEVLGEDHPFLEDVAEDLVALCHHPDAGEFVVSGWRKNGKSISFPTENGAHAGPGSEETCAFALLPGSFPLTPSGRAYLRARDLRRAVMSFLDRPPARAKRRGIHREKSVSRTVRLMTYNVHACLGMDGRRSPERIARVIAHYRPDVVALQELDVGRARSGEVDQAHAIAKALEMEFHFHPAMQLEEERYGDAVLSGLPMKLVRAGILPGISALPHLEPRGAVWVSISLGEGMPPLQLINTHLGLTRKERVIQVEALLGPEWIGHPDCHGSVILCGDFNASPGSPAVRKITRKFIDAQSVMEGHKPKKTWFSRYPVRQIDHVFLDQTARVVSVDVPHTALTRLASDHLPLIVDLEFD